MLSTLAEDGRELIVERVNAGIAAARTSGTIFGRPPSDPQLIAEKHQLVQAARAGAAEVAHNHAVYPFTNIPRLETSDARWVSGGLVGEVEFAEWTSTGRLREPSWSGSRPDKSADEVTKGRRLPRSIEVFAISPA